MNDAPQPRKLSVEILGFAIAQFIMGFVLYVFNSVSSMQWNPYEFNPTIRTISAAIYSFFLLYSIWKFIHDNFPKLGF